MKTLILVALICISACSGNVDLANNSLQCIYASSTYSVGEKVEMAGETRTCSVSNNENSPNPTIWK